MKDTKMPSRAVTRNVQLAQSTWGRLSDRSLEFLEELIVRHNLHLSAGDVIFLNGSWYVTNTGLLHVARRNGCRGIQVEPVREFCNLSTAHRSEERRVGKECRSRWSL